MNFELDDEQAALQDSVRRLLAEHGRFEQRRAAAASEPGHSSALWRGLAALGVTALAVPEAHGGFGRGAVGLLPVLQACGGALALEPLLASSVLGATALRLAADEATQARLLPAVAAGESLLAWGHDEADAGQETRAAAHGGGWVLDGRKLNVLHGAQAQHLVVSARVGSAAGDGDGLALFLVEAGAPGLRRRAHRLIDDTPAAELGFEATPAQRLGNARSALRGVQAMGTAATCADMVGAMEMAYGLAVEYLHTRRQFGRLIGENQALRHKAADMLVSLEMARSMAIAAAIAADDPGAQDSAADLHRAKLVIGRHARQLCHHAVQIHGGIGMTEEYAVGHALRRVHVMDHLFGDTTFHARELAGLLQ